MAKYSEEFKLKLVMEYQEGQLGYIRLAKKHGMKDSTPIKRWVKAFEAFENNGNYGYRRVHLELRNRGYKVNHKKVQRIMRKIGLKGIKFRRKSRKYSSYKGVIGKVANNRINRRFHTNVCHQKLTTDITEFKCSGGMKLYLSPIMDMFNSEILSYGIRMSPTLDLVLKSLN